MNTLLAQAGASKRPTRSRRTLALAALLSVLLWFLPFGDVLLYPLRIFVTLMHETGHALATVASGGGVEYIALSPNGNGVTMSRGGWPFGILLAGYLFSAAAGAACLVVARRAGAGRAALGALAVVTAVVALLWVHPWNGLFGFSMALLCAVALGACARFLRGGAADLALCFVAVQLGLNALSDVRYLLYLTTTTRSANDAVSMADLFGGTPWLWAGVFAVGSVVLVAGGLRAFWRSR